MRIWPMNHRTNQTLRPSLIDTEGDLDKAMIEGTKIYISMKSNWLYSFS